MSDARGPEPAGQPAGPSPMGRRGPLFASIWLFFLLNPLIAGWQEDDRLRGLAGVATTLLFAALYLSVWLTVRAPHDGLPGAARNPPAAAAAYLGGLSVLAAATMLLVGEPGIACLVYVAVASVMVLPTRPALVLVAAVMVLTLALAAVPGWGEQVGTAFAVVAASVAVLGVRTILVRNADLVEAQRLNASLAVENERTRFARDLHDILGHSLTVITVKAELAQRLLDVDRERTRAELVDLERLSRDALADVRRAVEGYRELTLPGELSRARTALDAAEIDARLPNSTDEVPGELRELFAWTVREGVTNVIRHSGARTCEVVLTPTSAEVRDDGAGCESSSGPGSGLAGLRERADAVGAVVAAGSHDRGYQLRVAVR